MEKQSIAERLEALAARPDLSATMARWVREAQAGEVGAARGLCDVYILEGRSPKRVPQLIGGWWLQDTPIENRRVALDVFGGCRVSTVFLALDYACPRAGGTLPPPLLFETLVCGGPCDGDMDRYSTWEEAQQGHREICRRVLDALHTETES